MNHLTCMTLALAALLLAATPDAANSQRAPVEKAAAAGNLKRLERLLAEGFDPGTLQDGISPLHSAAWNGQVEAARFLIEAGADVNAASTTGNTPLHLAAAKAGPEMVAFLLSVGADPVRATEKGFTALHVWALNGDPDTLTHLLDAGSDPLLRLNMPGKPSHQALTLDGVRKHNPQVLDTEPGRRLQRLTYKGTGCEGVIVRGRDTKLSLLAERTLGDPSRWKEIAKLNDLDGKGYRKGDCLALPKR